MVRFQISFRKSKVVVQKALEETKEPTIKEIIEKRIRSGTDDAYQTIARIINRDNLREDVSFESIYSEVLFASEGMMNLWYRAGNTDVDVFEQQYLKMIEHWEQVYKRGN